MEWRFTGRCDFVLPGPGAAVGQVADLPGQDRVLRHELPREELFDRLRRAVELQLAAVTVAPADLDEAARVLLGTPVKLATVIDRIGDATTAVKQYAVRDAIRRGARIVEAAMNRGKMRSREFRYLESELQQLVAACHEGQAMLRLSVRPWQENSEEFDLLTARIARRAGVDALGTRDLAHARTLMEHSRERYRVWMEFTDASSELVREAHAAGCAGMIVGCEDPDKILAEWASGSVTESS